MLNKKYLTIGIIIIVLIIAGYLVYTSLKSPVETSETNEVPNTSDAEIDQGTLGNKKFLTKEEVSEIFASDDYDAITSLDKTKCADFEGFKKENCINSIDLIQNALAASDDSLCFDSSIRVDSISRDLCIKKLNTQEN